MRLKIPFLAPKKSDDDLRLTKFFIDRFGYRPKQLNYFREAVTHSSITYVDATVEVSNERLEFLGDAILDAIIAEFLYQKFPDQDEGYLTKVKSKVVSRKTLSEIGEELGLRTILRYSKSRSINMSSLEGNAFEAIIGAIYLDGGYDVTKRIIHQYVFRKYVDLNKVLEEEIDFKSKLFIWCQKRKLNLEFTVISEENNHGNWKYEVVAFVNGQNYGKGSGTSKKAAEQAAAKETLLLVGEI
ncbi:MAG: ribonuclease III [Fluviicola sp.]|nr:ribonuclease III [Fluviicola sp.]MBP6271124.1 ribonuclease III [Fluviicola sp.]